MLEIALSSARNEIGPLLFERENTGEREEMITGKGGRRGKKFRVLPSSHYVRLSSRVTVPADPPGSSESEKLRNSVMSAELTTLIFGERCAEEAAGGETREERSSDAKIPRTNDDEVSSAGERGEIESLRGGGLQPRRKRVSRLKRRFAVSSHSHAFRRC